MEQAQKRKKIINSRPLFYGFLSLFFAICTARYVLQGDVTYLILDGVAILSLVVGCVIFRSWKTLILLLAIFMFGLGWFCVGQAMFVGKTYSGTVSITGRISDDVTYSSYGTSVTVVLKDVTVNSKSESNILLTISIDGTFEQEIGDIISFDAELENVKLFTLGSFNSSYYRDRTPYTASVDSDDITVTGNRTTLAEKFRISVKSLLTENMSAEHASTAYAVLFGDKNDMDSDVKEAYSSAGVVHLLSVSGLHVSFLIGLLGWILKKCRVKGWANVIVCAIFALIYSYLCGFTPSVLRASVMGVLLLTTMINGKRYDTLSSLGGAGIIIMVISPLSALDLGFQLSFFCVMAIVMLAPIITKVLEKIFPKKVAQGFSLTLSASLGIAPFVASMGSSNNLLSFFTNLIVVPIFSVLFPLLFVSVIFVLCFPILGAVLKASEFGFSLIYKFNQFMGQTSLQVTYDQLNVFAYAFFYLGLFGLSRFLIVRSDVRFLACTVLFCLCAAFEILPSIYDTQTTGLAYGYYYSQSVVVVTNSSKETILIDLSTSTFTKKVISSMGADEVSGIFLLQDTTLDIDVAQETGANVVIRADKSEGYENETLVDTNLTYNFGGFEFAYRAYNGTILGLELEYDDVSVFILKDRKTSDAALATLSLDYSIVILGKQTDYATYFNGKILTYSSSENSFASFESDGNVLVTNDLKRRCLD